MMAEYPVHFGLWYKNWISLGLQYVAMAVVSMRYSVNFGLIRMIMRLIRVASPCSGETFIQELCWSVLSFRSIHQSLVAEARRNP